jgi:hypothetical protein
LRQLCDHPALLRAKAGSNDPNALEITDEEMNTALMTAPNNESEISRALTRMGIEWVEDVKLRMRAKQLAQVDSKGKMKADDEQEVDMVC